MPTCRCWSGCATCASCRPISTSSSRFACSDTLDDLHDLGPAWRRPAPRQRCADISLTAHALVDEQYALYNDHLTPALKKAGIQILSHGERNGAQRRWVASFFAREVRPLLVPVSLDPAHPFPQVANKSLHFIVRLNGRDAFGRENDDRHRAACRVHCRA